MTKLIQINSPIKHYAGDVSNIHNNERVWEPDACYIVYIMYVLTIWIWYHRLQKVYVWT